MFKRIVLAGLFAIVSAGESAILSDGSFGVKILYRNTYDGNVLRYSTRDRDRFMDRTETYPSPVQTLDDLRTDFRTTLDYRYEIGRHLDGKLEATFNFGHYFRNSLNNLGWVSLTFRQEVTQDWTVLFNHFYEPYYFIRDYYDVHTKDRIHCDFTLSKSVAKVYYRPVGIIEFIGRGELKKYAYNKYFTEYDGDYLKLGGEAVVRFDKWRIAAGYGLAKFDNTGFESGFEFPSGGLDEDSQTGEGDYEQDEFELSIRYTYRLAGKRVSTQFGSTAEIRYYSTDRPPGIDPIHHGRKDVNMSYDISTSVRVTRKLDVEVGLDFSERDSRASDPIVSIVKDYNRWTGWIEFGYELR